MTPALRDYQTAALDALRGSYAAGHQAPLLVAPTGSGKTVIFRECARLAQARGNATLVVVHRRELVRQASEKLGEAGVEHGIIATGFPPTPGATVQVASVQTAIRRDIGSFGFVVADEGHHAITATWRKVIEAQAGARLLGCTATPQRLDGQGLGRDHGGIFDDLVFGATVAELTKAGWLCPAKVFVAKTKLNLRGVHTIAGDYNKGELARAVTAANIAGDAVGEYRKHADHQPAVAFCVSIEHGEATAAAFREAGYRAACVHGGLPALERDRLLAGLASGEIDVLSSCEILGEGVDIPTIGCAILLRPTKSLAVYLQQVGRGLRPAPGKRQLVVLDLAGNAITHGLPDEDRHWTLAGAPKRDASSPAGWVCGECECLNSSGAAFCLDCGTPRPHRPREITIDSETVLVELARRERLATLSYHAFMSRPRSRDELELYRRAHGYKKGWTWHAAQRQAELFGVTP